MADVKWIKIVTDIFDDEKIMLIESLPEADSIIVIWFKLLCLAGKQNNSGVFQINGRIPYTEEMFATIFRRKINTVRLALHTFEQYGMIEIINNTVTIPNWSKHQTLDQIERNREYMKNYMRQRREEQRLLASGESNSKTNCKTNNKLNSKSNVNSADKIREDKKRKESNTCFTPPTFEDVRLYAREKGYTPKEFDPQEFIDFYTQKGWKVGKDGMKDWKASVRLWVTRYRKEHPEAVPKQTDRAKMGFTELMNSMTPAEWNAYCEEHLMDGIR